MNSENEKILDIFRETGALMEGHFILRSGLHSGHFFQCARVCEHLDRVTELVEMLVKKLGDIECDTVIAPALGGLVVRLFRLGLRRRLRLLFGKIPPCEFASHDQPETEAEQDDEIQSPQQG